MSMGNKYQCNSRLSYRAHGRVSFSEIYIYTHTFFFFRQALLSNGYRGFGVFLHCRGRLVFPSLLLWGSKERGGRL